MLLAKGQGSRFRASSRVPGGSPALPRRTPCLRCFTTGAALLLAAGLHGADLPIDRHALVTRHNPELHRFDPNNPLSVGNGEFAFTADVTGLQTFADAFTNSIPLGTLAQWGWHSFPNPNHWSIDTFGFRKFDVFGRKVPYADAPGAQQSAEVAWLRENPHRLHLGRIGFVLLKANDQTARETDLTDIHQTLDLWNGALLSEFKLEGQAVRVQTLCHPDQDLLAVRVDSPLLNEGRIEMEIRFPYGSSGISASDWSRPDAHETQWRQPRPGRADFARRLDANSYQVAAAWSAGGKLAEMEKHRFRLTPSRGSERFELVCAFSASPRSQELPDFAETQHATVEFWNRFWTNGGAIDLSLSRDPRWFELERRMVLSQYLTAIQCAGSTPPAETGLTCNSWFGKFHLEMHWWHAAQFALWNRVPLLERNLGYYSSILSRAEATAQRQGYRGARWPKMTDPSGAESPSSVGPFLIWQEPHPIFYAELCYRVHPDRATLERYQCVVERTAEFMASYPVWEEARHRFDLGPVLQCAQEIFPKEHTLNPGFELTYWRWGLETAQRWRTRLGLPRRADWDNVLTNLSVPEIKADKYLFAETAPDCYSDPRWTRDHPSVTAALGMLPGPGMDPAILRATLDWIVAHWDWESTWGWDCPMLAMCAARAGEPELAVDLLLRDTPKNRFDLNGHNYQRPGLSVYLPGNGALLYATAMMAAGWDGAPRINAPGFPTNGLWTVRWEGLKVAP